MKILIDLSKLSDLNCGLGQVALNFGKTISKVTSEFLDVSFLVPKEFIGYFGSDINYYTYKNIDRNGFDIWHCIHQNPTILPGVDTKLIITIHDLNFLDEKSDRKAIRKLKKLQELVDKSSHLVFISEYSKKVTLENLDYLGKTSVIYNGVTTDKESSSSSSSKLISDKFFFTIGVFKEKKNFHVLLPVMEHFPDHKLVIAGDNKGSYYKKIKKIGKRLGIMNQIIFTGIISEKGKTWYYKNCDSFLFPSLHEGFGLPIIEAMQNGVPVITSNCSALPEIGGGFSFIFNDFKEISIRKQIELGIESYNKDSKFISDAILFSNSYTWSNIINSDIKLIYNLDEASKTI